MGDEALVAVVGGRNYDVRTFLAFARKLQIKVDDLNANAAAKASAFNCRSLERALWSEAVAAGTQRGSAFRKLKGGRVRKAPQATATNTISTRRKRKAASTAS